MPLVEWARTPRRRTSPHTPHTQYGNKGTAEDDEGTGSYRQTDGRVRNIDMAVSDTLQHTRSVGGIISATVREERRINKYKANIFSLSLS